MLTSVDQFEFELADVDLSRLYDFDLASTFNVVTIDGEDYETHTYLGKTRDGIQHTWVTEFYKIDRWEYSKPFVGDEVFYYVSQDHRSSKHLRKACETFLYRK